MTLTARPPAKVNLTLEVGPRRGDGFHDLRSVMMAVGLSDLLSLTPALGPDSLELAGLPCPVENNLVLRAFEALRQAANPRLPGLAATLDKRIPIAAGLGGGSSDAAAALELAAASWAVGVSPDQKRDLALELGSDVPFFASGAPVALVEGRGGRVSLLPSVRDEVGLLLAVSSAPLSTADVFARFDELGPLVRSSSPTDDLVGALSRGMTGADLAEAASGLRDANDLWPAAAALLPALSERRTVLERSTDRPWLLSGSGPTLFALYPTVHEAVAAGQRLSAGRPDALAGVMLCATDLSRDEPAWREPWPTDR